MLIAPQLAMVERTLLSVMAHVVLQRAGIGDEESTPSSKLSFLSPPRS
jgi:hypothetical protein